MSSGFVAAGIVGSGAHFGLYVDILEAFMKSEILDGCSPVDAFQEAHLV